MITHSSLGYTSFARSRNLNLLISENKIAFGGNISQKIYGTLKCKSGKRLKIENRIFLAHIHLVGIKQKVYGAGIKRT